MTDRTWDVGDPEPDGVTAVHDHTHTPWDHGDWDRDSSRWGRTVNGEWKGYKNGGKAYLDWAELVRRWGPVVEIPDLLENLKRSLTAVRDTAAGEE